MHGLVLLQKKQKGVKKLNYKSFVGNENEFDYMAASQFSLLFHFGMREYHKILDFGCGCLRLGRLLIPFLNCKNYIGFDPNKKLYKNFILKEYSEELINIKKTNLINKIKFIPQNLDYIMAHSIFTHTGIDLLDEYFSFLIKILNNDGFLFATFYLSKEKSNLCKGWKYKDCYGYNLDYINNLAQEKNVYCHQLNWWHPRQTWFCFSKKKQSIYKYKSKPIKNIFDIKENNKNKELPDKYFECNYD